MKYVLISNRVSFILIIHVCLFNDAVSSTDHTTQNGELARTWKEAIVAIFEYYPRISLGD